MTVPILFVDDEEDIRFSFELHFEGRFPIRVASNGVEALETLASNSGIGVVVTDIRMPEMNGLELIRQARDRYPDVGFIVVSGHGEAEQIIEAMKLGARNFLRKPYDLPQLEDAIALESRRFQILRDERLRQQKEKYVEQFVTGVEKLVYALPNDFNLVAPVALGLAHTTCAVGLCDESETGNIALALMEIITNAMEHGNLEIDGAEKTRLKLQGDRQYLDEIESRQSSDAYKARVVTVTASLDRHRAVFIVEDEGKGFDYHSLPDPHNAENLFLPSGRGVLLARSFLDGVDYKGKGNVVHLTVLRRRHP